ncbi:myristoyl-CoA:protein N-myristoyltransferase [Tritrichomonas foetus]|uniref:Glycylpeptide N-tetradecanoyltransferase n=1 Tax=Tritrichomonas foetus TaxID=1144522 RepID=A0A1J4K3J0_9EUKA|nr:myristoyl-CoA:protein N-myristoyltransferase [Tritrichomonas foetus]|eukprot:OHT06009.1 myristoyl-CoA:protein N-myristoyltransferase [Tritrichomonas foetus]
MISPFYSNNRFFTSSSRMTVPEPHTKEHQFWNTQPVTQIGAEKPAKIGPLDPNTDVAKVRQEPYPIVKGFNWCLVDTKDEVQRQELYEFLRNHYVNHPQNTFRFAYSAEFLDWALHPPGWRPEWLVGVRAEATGKLAAFISAIPITVRANGADEPLKIVAVDFLSVHQQLRGKNLAPLLIKEITRRVNLTGCFTAIFTAGKLINQPISRAQYRHRLVNYKKLCAIKFTAPRPNENIDQQAKRFALAQQPREPGFRPMEERDVPQVTEKLNEFLQKYAFSQVFSEEEVKHWFLPRENIIGSYVVEKKKQIIDFISFYIVPSTVSGCDEYDSYTAAYLYYYFSKPSRLTDICRAAMCVAHHQYGADVINCLDILDNKNILESLRFVDGDGHLNYYFYNYAYPEVPPEQCGVVLL